MDHYNKTREELSGSLFKELLQDKLLEAQSIFVIGGQHTTEMCVKLLELHGLDRNGKGTFQKVPNSHFTSASELQLFTKRLLSLSISPFTLTTLKDKYPHILNGIQLLGHKFNVRAKKVKETTVTDLLSKCREMMKRDICLRIKLKPHLSPAHGEIWPRNELERRSEIYQDNNLGAVVELYYNRSSVSLVKSLVLVPQEVSTIFQNPFFLTFLQFLINFIITAVRPASRLVQVQDL